MLKTEDWHDLLNSWLCPRANVEFLDHVLPELAKQLPDKFALALPEVLKIGN
ncbi:hypothetical protein NG791_22395 [Laspinema sp. D1]|uniref:hypothetical protein n=1 Tax=Laspinema palackyanum TaxID=3231601 RepID=UPI0034852A62|nr:hypothetical protein [Laspinema sp. D2b]